MLPRHHSAEEDTVAPFPESQRNRTIIEVLESLAQLQAKRVQISLDCLIKFRQRVRAKRDSRN